MGGGRNVQVTQLLEKLSDGDDSAADQLLPLVYEDLRGLADGYFRFDRGGHTLQPTALVHEAFVKLVQSSSSWKSRAHFFAVAATAMRQIMIDHARRKRTEKHGGGLERVTLDNLITPNGEKDVDIVALDEILAELARLDPRQYRIVEMRFFGGLTEEEVATILGVSRTTVQSEWRAAKAWLSKELRKAESQ